MIPVSKRAHGHAPEANRDIGTLLARLCLDLVVEVRIAGLFLHTGETDSVDTVDFASMPLHYMVLSGLPGNGALPLTVTLLVLDGLAPLFVTGWQLTRHGNLLQRLGILSPDDTV